MNSISAYGSYTSQLLQQHHYFLVFLKASIYSGKCFLTLKLSGTSTNCEASIFNTLGQIIESSAILSGAYEYTYPLNNIPPESYFVKVNTSHNMYQ